jgi:uncharacterized membrane protein/uncharacterized lipoprotein YbaY
MRVSPRIVALLALTSACGGADPEGQAARSDQAAHGVVVFPDSFVPPAGSALEVDLVDLNLSDAGRAILSSATTSADRAELRFTVPYDSTQVESGRENGLVGRLRGPDGRQLYASDRAQPVPFRGGQEDHVLVLVPTPEGSPRDLLHAPDGRHFRCGDRWISTGFDGRVLTLNLEDRLVRLMPAVSDSGARFGDGSNEIWVYSASAATLILDGGAPLECIGTDSPSPWEEARRRGMAFRALGNEPGWVVEVESGDRPAMRAILDYGERTESFASTEPLEGAEGFRGRRDGLVFELTLTRERCSDGMSDIVYPVAVRLVLVEPAGRRELRGCGRFLGG